MGNHLYEFIVKYKCTEQYKELDVDDKMMAVIIIDSLNRKHRIEGDDFDDFCSLLGVLSTDIETNYNYRQCSACDDWYHTDEYCGSCDSCENCCTCEIEFIEEVEDNE